VPKKNVKFVHSTKHVKIRAFSPKRIIRLIYVRNNSDFACPRRRYNGKSRDFSLPRCPNRRAPETGCASPTRRIDARQKIAGRSAVGNQRTYGYVRRRRLSDGAARCIAIRYNHVPNGTLITRTRTRRRRSEDVSCRGNDRSR